MIRLAHTWTPVVSALPVLLSASYSERPVPPAVHRCRNPFWVFDYSISPCGHSRVGSVDAPWRERGTHVGHLYPPNTVYWEDFSATPVICSAHSIFQADPGNHLRGCIPDGEIYARVEDAEGRLESLLREAARAGAERGAAGFWQAQGAFLRILDSLMQATRLGREDIRIEDSVAQGPSAFVRQTHAFFEQHLSERITLDQLARELHISPSTLSHRYVRETGIPPMSALIARRIERVRELLLRGLRLDAIAQQTGFHDAFHLSKTFKKRVGMSPRNYINQIDPAKT
jgi:AraC-like DNA-binding protein